MSANLNVVQIERAPVSDIPQMLRNMAKRIEDGDFGEVETLFAVMPRAGDYPQLFGWGHIDGNNDPLIQLELTKHWLLSNLVGRSA